MWSIKHTQFAEEPREPRADFAKGSAVVLPEFGNLF